MNALPGCRLSRTFIAVSSAMAVWTGTASGQEPESSEPTLEEVVVTGSRISRSGYDTPTPVSVLRAEEIAADAPGSVAEFVMQLPSVQGSTTASTSSGSLSAGGAGVSALNLRDLGTGRTLVLFDGQRSVPSRSTGQVDTNTFPQPLVESVEIVTGGASSVYGSDAIAGVVNFKLDRDYTGIKSSFEYGETSRGDNAIEKIQFTAGTPFAGDGHFLFSAEVYDTEGVHYTTREWAENARFAIVSPYRNQPGHPHFIVSDRVGISSYSPGGLITGGPLMGTYFGDGGAVGQLNYGDVSSQWMIGGDYQYTTSAMLGTNSLAADDERESIFTRASWNLESGIEIFAQLSYAQYEGYSFYVRPRDTRAIIQRDNAFLDPTVAAAMDANGLTEFTMGTNNADMPASGSNNKRDTTRIVLGANGDFGGNRTWTWDAYFQSGMTDTDEHQNPTYNFARLAEATDAVFHPTTNEIVCRSTLTDPTSACVPLNRMGVGVATQAGLDYVLGRPRRQQEFEQNVIAANISTNDFEGWAGPISLAIGAEARTEEISGFVEEEMMSGWKYGNYKVTEGDYDVQEVYAESIIPLSQRVEFNGAVRRTEYSTSGSVSTWKAGFVFSPMDALTIRLTQSRDIRAPNLSELFDAGTARTNAVTILGQSVPFIQNLQGTPTVGAEEADTLGVGFVVTPSWAPRAAASVDYYDIEVNGVIDFLGAEEVAEACTLFNVQRYCDQMNYENGVLQTIDLYYENLNSLKASGVDLEFSYSIPMGGAGDLSLRALATHYLENITDDRVTAVDNAGSNANDTPDWVYRLTAMYTRNDWVFNVTARGVSDGVINNAYIECQTACPASVAPNFTINDNSVDGEFYFDAYLANTFRFRGTDAEFFLSVKNIFDTDPAFVGLPASQGSENRPAYLQTNRNLYDVMGRNYRLGVRFQF